MKEKIKETIYKLDFEEGGEIKVKFKDFGLKIVSGENDFDEDHPRYTCEITLVDCKCFKDLTVYEISDCYYCNYEAKKDMIEKLLKSLEGIIDIFYNQEDEVKKDIKIHKKEIDRRTKLIEELNLEIKN